MHTIIFLDLSSLITKLYQTSKSNTLFNSGSLELYLCGIIVYSANIITGLGIVTQGTYSAGCE